MSVPSTDTVESLLPCKEVPLIFDRTGSVVRVVALGFQVFSQTVHDPHDIYKLLSHSFTHTQTIFGILFYSWVPRYHYIYLLTYLFIYPRPLPVQKEGHLKVDDLHLPYYLCPLMVSRLGCH